MIFVVTRHIATAIRWPQRNIMPHKRTSLSRISWDVREPVGTVNGVSFDDARRKAAAKYPTVEKELLRVTIA